MQLLSELDSLGVNTKEGLARVMDDESLYTMMLDMFVDTVQSAPISPGEFDGGSLEKLIEKVHTLKGTTGNLSLEPLFVRYTRSLELLREKKPAEAKTVFEELLPIQEKIVECIRKHQ
ncbi:MAG: hypothetical protein K2O18_01080 [Oscillospiraceae bacterium]|nr:hypothetical protein [Oscillospiraceae bacterium]